MAKRKSDLDAKTSNRKLNIIRQVCDKGMDVWINDCEIFLSPQNFCLNIQKKIQEKKPKTPAIAPDRALRKVLREKGREGEGFDGSRSQRRGNYEDKDEEIDDKERDWSNHPLLSPDKRIQTLINFLAI
jgi:ssDNA-binding Zn-finger/Zn-ribbon topoisomerase 1